MEGWWLVGLALGLPWLVSAIWLRLSWGEAPAGIWPLTVGYSYILGSLAVTLLLRSQAALGFTPNVVAPLSIIGSLAMAGGWLAWRRGKSGLNFGRVESGWRQQPLWQQILFVMLLAWLGWRLAGLALEIWWRPLYPWDAWTTWTVRPKVWAELGRLAPFVDPPRWLADPKGAFYTIEAWTYPATVPLLVLWPTLAFGGWNETAANLPWFGAALGLGFGFYGQARLWGATPMAALIFTWLLLSLPMLDTHVALAGYADLWMTVVFSLAALAFFQWVRGGDRRQGFLALLLAAACPLIKLEGTVWLVLFVPALVVIWLRGLRLWLLGTLIVVLGAVWWSMGGVSFAVPGLGEFQLRPDLIKIPYLGQFNLVYRGTWGPVIKNFLVLANWHLLWYLGLAAAVAVIPALYTERWRRIMAVFVGSCLSMLFVLFFLTDAQRWAEEYTSINRVFLHCVPALLFWIMTVFIPAGGETPQAVSRKAVKASTATEQPFV
ncbi:MAG: hypothetical protein IPK63_08265 [Candidatus Competibacteraceae bacterium]|nr:hypothetical protein [Candidatus Competibacteraceae bacterium]